ncbi:vascular endothelial growth factor receptor 1-like isoform X1 [Belonocnema kinseyi]|uniref:vascular endothelial growth factor receptor 1-like isoform X1 n=1 Tax=Belonocnema kinseyi TaxID=2817044 RepID=UPI00143D36C7|nr:vascular endothelial growth factor receptor 1-like isoform X1 [Belonocnema kinseyi]
MLFINQILILIFLTLFSELLGHDEIPNWWIGKHPHKTLVINEGDPIEISCLAENSIFYYPKHSGTSNFTITQGKKDSESTLNIFRRHKAVHGDSDFYCCLKVNSTTINVDYTDNDFSAEIPLNLTYVYVRSKKYAFANRLSRNVWSWTKGTYMRVFCRPSSPDLHVELEHHYRGNRKVITHDKRVFWEPKFGFIVKNVQPVVDDGLYVCKANHNGHNKELLYPISITEDDVYNSPYISKNEEPLKRGDSVHLACRVLLENFTKHELNWITPRKNNKVTTKIHSEKADAGFVVTNELLITNFTEDDQGEYQCDFVHFNKAEPEVKSVTESLKIYDSKTRYMKIIYDRAENSFVRYTGDSLYIIVEVDAFPRPKVQWLNPRGADIQDSEKISVYNSYFYPRLIIEDIGLADGGVYTLQVSLDDEIQMMKFTLEVKPL